ncbi:MULTISPECIES: superinfection immunity protein [Pantoea]|uniref:Superinfection immunity protein n=1 Tax=Candidatus Pantoea floridensis TaxID=1938870 RepID=A0A286C010_9GAMM|nr:superinfection immunity protein [Pantoea floridensis]PIF22190.1 T4 superinfection immunity protein [Enterobacteriaceae bacterium JKS000233]PXW18526.1 T4 superinfection immunity protein [Pantoea sp. JKS000250]SOD39697.1 Superinfection immunity protein [Pantoea floridensis]
MAILFLIVLYFLPTFIGIIRYRLNIWAIILTNLVFGWTLIGWIVALIMAIKSDENDRLNHVIKLLEKRKD